MTSVINENDNLLPQVIPTEEKSSDILQLIHPDLLEEIDIPTPPNNSPEIEIIPGQFEYITKIHEREMLMNAFQAITLTETWDFVKQPIGNFMFNNDPRLGIINNKMEELGYCGHSGASFGFTMRAMQYIAIYGEKKFKG